MKSRINAERMAINAPLQASASDIIKKAMVEIEKWLNDEKENKKDGIKMILQIHDELVFEVKKQKLEMAQAKIKQIMENVFQFKVPLIVNLSSSNSLAMQDK